MQEIIAPDRRNRDLSEIVKSYFQLTKPRIIVLLLITTAGAMWIAAEGKVDPQLFLITVGSGALAAAAANTINCIYDRDIDFKMERTQHRPLPSGRVSPRDALVFAIILAVIAFCLLYVFANLLAAVLAMSGIAVYVGIYTVWLKRTSTQNIVIGGAAGAIPPLVGWAAVTGELSWAAWALFAIIFVWTPPHFWALALMIKDEYAKVEVPMLPVVVGCESTSRQIFAYTILLVPVSFLLVFPLHVMGAVYGIAALVLGFIFIFRAWQLLQNPSEKLVARNLFKYSILYLMLLCVAMGVDSLPITNLVFAKLISFRF